MIVVSFQKHMGENIGHMDDRAASSVKRGPPGGAPYAAAPPVRLSDFSSSECQRNRTLGRMSTSFPYVFDIFWMMLR